MMWAANLVAIDCQTWCGQAQGHAVRLLPARAVKPYVQGNKTDRADAAGILEADRCEQQAPLRDFHDGSGAARPSKSRIGECNRSALPMITIVQTAGERCLRGESIGE